MNRKFDIAIDATGATGQCSQEKSNFSVSSPASQVCAVSWSDRCLAALRRHFAQATVMVLIALTPTVAFAEPGNESYESVANMLGAMERYKMPRTLRRRNSSDEVYVWGVAEHSADDFTRMTGWRVSKSLHVGYQQGLDSGLSLLWQGERDQMSLSSDGIRFTRRF